MKSLFILAGLFSIAVFASTTNARKDPGQYWGGVKQNEPMLEFVEGLVDVSKVTSVSTKKNHCHTSTTSRNFEPRPNISAYNDNSKQKEEKFFVKDFEPRPNISAYNDNSKQEETKAYVKDFEPRPNVSAYNDDVKPNDEKSFTEEEKSFVKDFEPRPNVSAYNDDVVGEKAKNAFEKDFQPQPNVSV